jgi:hypothetical protein
MIVPYSCKIWRELYLADWSQPARNKYWRILIWRIAKFALATPRICLHVRTWNSIVDIEGEWLATRVPLPSIEQAAYEGKIFPIISKSNHRRKIIREIENEPWKIGCSSSDLSERHVVHELLLEPKDHTHQVTSRCAIAFAHAKYGNDLIFNLAGFNLAVGWSIRQTAKFSGYTVVCARGVITQWPPIAHQSRRKAADQSRRKGQTRRVLCHTSWYYKASAWKD